MIENIKDDISSKDIVKEDTFVEHNEIEPSNDLSRRDNEVLCEDDNCVFNDNPINDHSTNESKDHEPDVQVAISVDESQKDYSIDLEGIMCCILILLHNTILLDNTIYLHNTILIHNTILMHSNIFNFYHI